MADDRPDESGLCRSCGLCCQGQLHSWVELRPDEVALAKTWPIDVVTQGDATGFHQPCGCFRSMRCTVYAQRPLTCAEYSCLLLRRVREKEVTEAAALARVAEARQLVEQIEGGLPAARGQWLWRRISEKWQFESLQPMLASGALTPTLLMAIVALDAHLQNHFRNPKPTPGSSE